jgi:competence protein ComEA
MPKSKHKPPANAPEMKRLLPSLEAFRLSQRRLRGLTLVLFLGLVLSGFQHYEHAPPSAAYEQLAYLAAVERAAPPPAGSIDYNQADSLCLLRIDGIGPHTAHGILKMRGHRGAFQQLEELGWVDGIGTATLEKLRHYGYVRPPAPPTAPTATPPTEAAKPAKQKRTAQDTSKRNLNKISEQSLKQLYLIPPDKAEALIEEREQLRDFYAWEEVRAAGELTKAELAKMQARFYLETVTGCLNLNEAQPAELKKLPGIGPTLAQRILQYRKAHNGFGKVAELAQVKGIGPKTLSRLAPRLCI